VVDVGCGTGLSGEALQAAGFRNLVGTDVSDTSLQLCLSKGIYQSVKNVDLECTDGPLPFEENSVAGITSVGVFSYIHNFGKLFPEFCRIVAPGGLVVFTDRVELWDEDDSGRRTAAEACPWERLFESQPEAYMPKNPDPAESAKRIRYHVYRVL